MNRLDVQMVGDALDGLRDSILRRRMQQQQDQQRMLDNQIRQAMFDFQKSTSDRDFGFRSDRAAVEDERYADTTKYQRGRDTLSDKRYDDSTGYQRGRDAVADRRYDTDFNRRVNREASEDELKKMEMAMRLQQSVNRGNVGGYMTEEVDPETGEVTSLRRRTPILRDGTPAKMPGVTPRNRPKGDQPMTREALIDAVKTGRMTKDEAKEYARAQGWN